MKVPILKLRDKDGNEIAIPAIRGRKGDPGGAVLTEEDKAEIVADVLAALPNAEEAEF